MNERYIRWWTPHMSREFEMLAFGNGGGMPLILFPTSFGRHTQNKDFGLTDAIAGFVDGGKITIYCPDSADLDSLYNQKIHPRHESHRLSEILNSKGIQHWLDDGRWRGHDWNYWRDMLPHYLSKICS